MLMLFSWFVSPKMRLFYHVEGIGIGELVVYTRTEVNGPLTKVWSQVQQRGDNWFYASIGLGIETTAFQVTSLLRASLSFTH